MFLPDIGIVEDGDKWHIPGGLLNVHAAIGFCPLHQAQHSNDLESCLACRLDGLNCRSSGGAHVIYDDHSRALLVKALDAFCGAVCLLRFANEEAVDVPARWPVSWLVVSATVDLLCAQHGHSHHNRV